MSSGRGGAPVPGRAAGRRASPDLLTRPAEESARRLGLELLDAAAAAADRLGDAEDREALHDFRVALRRLRSTLGAYRDLLGNAYSKSMRKRLRRVAEATGAGRDAEVALAWLEQAGIEDLGLPAQRATRRLADELETERDASRAAAGQVCSDFAELAQVLRRRLSVYSAQVDLASGAPEARPFASAAERAFATALEALRDLLSALPEGDPDISHRSRIALKRLRYLAEPLRHHAPGSAAMLGPMRRLQDLLGELQDVRVLRDRIAAEAAGAAAERQAQMVALVWSEGIDGNAARARARRGSGAGGLLRLLEKLRARDLGLRAVLERDWLSGGGIAGLLAQCQRWVDHLSTLVPSRR